MLAWMSRESLEQTLESGRATFWSRSRQALWEKGETSGNALDVVGIAADCDGDALLLRCHPRGPACHTGTATCFGPRTAFPARLGALIEERRNADAVGSYTARLLGGPRAHAARKVGEEAVETLLADPGSDELVGEIADLWFHSMVLLAWDGVDPLAPLRTLERRHRSREPR
jgi:phosphoribosyl-ATP pyrophosphohydrolase/phosphoribosyl-AMP cyclohydrolase